MQDFSVQNKARLSLKSAKCTINSEKILEKIQRFSEKFKSFQIDLQRFLDNYFH